MSPGDLVRWAFPQADGRVKLRPALLLAQVGVHGDWIACAVSSSLGLFSSGMDLVIDQDHPDFKTTELPRPALIRTGFLDTIPSRAIQGKVGHVSKATVQQLRRNLADRLLNVEDLK